MNREQLAEEAKRILESPLFVAACKTIRDRVYSAWTMEQDREKREVLWFEYQAATNIINEIGQHIQNYHMEMDVQQAQAAEYGIY